MNIAGIQFPVFNPYQKATIEIYISGCSKGCIGCHNPELQDFKYGKKLNKDEIITYLMEREKLFSILAFTGGEWLDQNLEEVKDIIYWIIHALPDYGNKKIEFWLFTGKEKFQIPNWCFEYFDKIKIGCYEEKLKQEGFPASSNQKLLLKGKDY